MVSTKSPAGPGTNRTIRNPKGISAFERNPKLTTWREASRQTAKAQASKRYTPNGARECARRSTQWAYQTRISCGLA